MAKRKPHSGKPLCGARTKQRNPDGTVKLCTRTELGTGGRCKWHGGKTPVGIDSPNWKTGRWSKYLPGVQGTRWREAMADPELMKIRQHVAITDNLMVNLLKRMPERGDVPEQLERRMVNLGDQHRKLIEAEAKRMQALSQTVTLPQLMQIMGVVADLFREFVTDDKDLAEVQRRLSRLMTRQPDEA